MKIKIVSDGTVIGTKIVNVDTEEILENVSSISLKADASYGFLATIVVVGPELDITTEVEVKHDNPSRDD